MTPDSWTPLCATPTARFSARSARRVSWARRSACTRTRHRDAMDVFTLANARGMEVRFIALRRNHRLDPRAGPGRCIRRRHARLRLARRLLRTTDGFSARSSGDTRTGSPARALRSTDVEYSLTSNEGENQLHGGPGGFHRATWRVTPSNMPEQPERCSAHRSDAGDQGFPGTLDARVTYARHGRQRARRRLQRDHRCARPQ